MTQMTELFPVALSAVEITVEKQAFMIPEYNFRLVIDGSGQVTFSPNSFYSTAEPIEKTIASESVKDLIAAALEIGFFEMKSDYSEKSILEVTSEGTIKQTSEMILDGEAMTISIKMGAHRKRIYAYYGFPKRLRWFYQLILTTAGVSEEPEDWIDE